MLFCLKLRFCVCVLLIWTGLFSFNYDSLHFCLIYFFKISYSVEMAMNIL